MSKKEYRYITLLSEFNHPIAIFEAQDFFGDDPESTISWKKHVCKMTQLIHLYELLTMYDQCICLLILFKIASEWARASLSYGQVISTHPGTFTRFRRAFFTCRGTRPIVALPRCDRIITVIAVTFDGAHFCCITCQNEVY